MIFGIGTDIVHVPRMEENLTRHGERFAQRVLSSVELTEFAHAARPAQFLAKRFAAKEAAAKALGTGFRDGLALRHITISHDTLGKPGLAFTDAAAALCERFGINEAFLSLADENDYAVAYVVLWRRASQ